MSLLNPLQPADNDYLSLFPALWRNIKLIIQAALDLEHSIVSNGGSPPTNVYTHNVGFPCDNSQFSVDPNPTPVQYNLYAGVDGSGLKYWNGSAWQLLQIGVAAELTSTGTFSSQAGLTYQVIAWTTNGLPGTVSITGVGFTSLYMQPSGGNNNMAFDMFQYNGTLTVTLSNAYVWILPI